MVGAHLRSIDSRLGMETGRLGDKESHKTTLSEMEAEGTINVQKTDTFTKRVPCRNMNRVDNMKLFWLTIWLIIWSQFATAQVGLQPPEQKEVPRQDETREYWVYNYHIRWEGVEVFGDRNVLDVTYDLVRISLFVYGNCQPDSIISAHEIGDGIAEAMKNYWKKGYGIGLEEGTPTTLEKISYGFCGAAIVFGIIATIDLSRN